MCYTSNPTAQTQPANTQVGMTTVREESQYVLRDLKAQRTRLLEQVRGLDRAIALIDFLDSDNHKLRAHIQTTNRRQREVVSAPLSQSYKRVRSPTFSEDFEEGDVSKM